MKYVLVLLIAVMLAGCEKRACCVPEFPTFRIEATGQKFDFKITRRISGTANEGILESLTGLSDPFSFNFTPEIGKTYKVYLSGAGLISWKIIYKGQVLMSEASPGTGLEKDFEIKN